jgi:Arc/MetJ family transcription regulator
MIWVTHMKTTIDIADPLLERARKLAQRRNTTLKALVEEALRRTLKEEAGGRAVEPLRTHTFRGRGLQPGLSWDDWNALRSLAYEERGG